MADSHHVVNKEIGYDRSGTCSFGSHRQGLALSRMDTRLDGIAQSMNSHVALVHPFFWHGGFRGLD